jgi:hypothetical protein
MKISLDKQECLRCDEYEEGFPLRTYEGRVNVESDVYSHICCKCLLIAINKQYSIEALLMGVKIK